MAQVFISHSRKDQRGKDFLQPFFASVEHRGLWYSWDEPQPPHAERLISSIASSASVFVVLSPEMENPHTRSWVAFEVGVAAAYRKNVWVFEPQGLCVDVPVPYVTGYVQYPADGMSKKEYPYYNIVETAGVNTQFTRPPGQFARPTKVTCTKPECRASYLAYARFPTEPLPVIGAPSDANFTERAKAALADFAAKIAHEGLRDYWCPVCRQKQVYNVLEIMQEDFLAAYKATQQSTAGLKPREKP